MDKNGNRRRETGDREKQSAKLRRELARAGKIKRYISKDLEKKLRKKSRVR